MAISGSGNSNTALLASSLDRRNLLKAAGVTSLGVSLLGSQSVRAQEEESTLIFLATDTAYSLDPAENWDAGGGSTILAHVYDSLFRFTGAEQAVLEPVVAAEIPTIENGGISEDGLTYTVKLKPNVHFHDGTPVNAEAVKFSYDRTKALKLGVDFLLDQIEETEAVDDLTVRFHLQKPFSAFLNSIGTIWGNSIVSPTTVNENSTGEADMGHEYLLSHDAGSGAYILESYDPDQKQAVMVRDPNWWQGWSDEPHIDRVVIQWIAEAATIRSMLERGDAHIVAGLTPEDWQAVSTMDGITAVEQPSNLQSWIVLNNKQAPLDNVKVRQALNYAFDYDQAINGIMGGHGAKLDSVVPPTIIGYSPAKTQYTYDPEKAKALLAEAGYPDGFDLQLYAIHIFQNDQLLLEMYQANLAEIGVNLEVQVMDANAFLSQHLAGDPQAAFPGYIGNVASDYPDAYELLALIYGKRSQPPAVCCNYEFYENPQMEEILTRVEEALDPEERQAALQEGFDLAFADAAVIWIHYFNQLIGMRDSVQGWEYNAMFGANYAPFEKMSLTG
jgi:peptide/nickel transport system substrate-binding protein